MTADKKTRSRPSEAFLATFSPEMMEWLKVKADSFKRGRYTGAREYIRWLVEEQMKREGAWEGEPERPPAESCRVEKG